MEDRTWQEWDLQLALLNRRGGQCVFGLVACLVIFAVSLTLGGLTILDWIWAGILAGLAIIVASVLVFSISSIGKSAEEAEIERSRAMSEWKPSKDDTVDWNRRRSPKPSSVALEEQRRDQEKKDRKNRSARRYSD